MSNSGDGPVFSLDINIEPVTNKVEAVVTRTDGGKFSCTPDPNNKNGSQENNVPVDQWPPDYDQATNYLQSIVVNSEGTDRSSIIIHTDFAKNASGKILMVSIFDESDGRIPKKRWTTVTVRDLL